MSRSIHSKYRKNSLNCPPFRQVQMSEVWPTRKDSEPRPRFACAGSPPIMCLSLRRLVLPLIFSPSRIAQQKSPDKRGFFVGLPWLSPVESLKGYADAYLLYEYLPLMEQGFWPVPIGEQGGATMRIITRFFQIVNTKSLSKIHFQCKCIPRYVPIQSEIPRINIAILPVYAKSPMIQVIRLFLVYAVVIYFHFVVV